MTKQRSLSGKRRHWAYVELDPDNIEKGKALESFDALGEYQRNLLQRLFSGFKQNLKVHQNLSM